MNNNITIVSCWYILKSKFDKNLYSQWIDNFFRCVTNCNIIIYTNEESKYMLNKYLHLDNLKIIILELEDFYNYKYKDYWIINHKNNYLLNNKIGCELNMLWNEKISFVKDTRDKNYFNTEWYIYCDVGYFRNRQCDLNNIDFKNWPNNNKILSLNNDKIYYAKVNNNSNIFNNYIKIILNKNDNGLPKIEIPHNQVSIAGGFFIIHKNKINWYQKLHDNKLKLYFNNNRLVKDDQIIVLNNIIDNLNNFQLISENDNYDNWFLFQRFLL